MSEPRMPRLQGAVLAAVSIGRLTESEPTELGVLPSVKQATSPRAIARPSREVSKLR
jgi:hypothetical protein